MDVLREMSEPMVWDECEKVFSCRGRDCPARLGFDVVPVPHNVTCPWTRRGKILKEVEREVSKEANSD